MILKPKKGYKLVKWLFGKEIEIPEEWEIIRQGIVCEFINGYAYSQAEISDTGYPIIRIQNLTGGTNYVHSNVELPEKQFAEDGDLLYAWSATFLPFIWHGKKSAFHYHQWKVIPNELSDKIFLFYHFERITPTIKNMGQSGLGMFHMTKNGMERFLFLKPPLLEQKQIASILSNVDALIESTQKVIDQTITLKKGLMQKLLTKGIGHKKFKKTKWLFRKEIEIPEDWEVKQLDDILKIVQYGISKPMFKEGKYPIFRMNSIQKSKVIESDMKFIDLTTEEFKKYKLEKEDLLFNRTNSYNLVGKIGIFLLEGNFTFAGYLIRLRTNEKMNPIFLNNYLNTKSSRYNVKRFATPAVSQTNINAENLKSVIITVPPRQEQDKIAIILSNIDSQIQSQIQYKEKLEKLKKSLMQKLLIGEIRVKV